MAGNFRDSCKRFCHEAICEIIIAILSAGATVAGAVYLMVDDLQRVSLEQSILVSNTVQALDAHTKLERESTQEIMRSLGSLAKDVAVVESRLRFGATTRPQSNVAAMPDTP